MGEAVASLPSIEMLVLGFLASLLGALVQFTLGMGFGLAAAPILAVVDPSFVPGPPLILGAITAALGAWRERSAVIVSEVSVASVGRAIGAVIAAIVLVHIADTSTFSFIFGVGILVTLAITKGAPAMLFNHRRLLAASVLSGIIGTITSVGAAPLAILYRSRLANQARPTLNALFAIGAVVSVVALWGSGWLGPRELIVTAIFSPSVALGYWARRHLQTLASPRFGNLLWLIAGCAATVLVLKPLFS